jgi:hypothetical protein
MRKINIAAAAALVGTLAFANAASAQQAIFYPPSYSWSQAETPNFPGNIHGSVGAPTHHHEPHATRPYGQW